MYVIKLQKLPLVAVYTGCVTGSACIVTFIREPLYSEATGGALLFEYVSSREALKPVIAKITH